MANQAIALQARAPQGNFLAPAIQQGAQMINMMSQQRAAERQAAVQQQQLDIARTQESRAAAKAPFELAEAKEKALTAQQKNTLGFYDLVAAGVKNSSTPDQVMIVADFLKKTYPGATQQIDQKLSDMPADPAGFNAWREKTMLQSLDAKDQLTKEFTTQNLGTSTRVLRTPKFGGGAGEVVPGSEAAVTIKPTVVNIPGIGAVIVDPNTSQGYPAAAGPVGGYTPPGIVGGPRGGGVTPVATALQTNPGAIRDGAFARLQPGYAGASGGFATFNTPQEGVAAQENLLAKDYVGKGFNTINKIVSRYAPPGGENPPAAVANYKKYVAQQTGIDMDAPITAAQVPAIAAAMRQFETGQRPAGATAPAGAPKTIQQAATALERARTVEQFKDITGFDFETGDDPVAKLIEGSTSGGAEKLGADIMAFIPKEYGGGSTPGMENIAALEVIGADLMLALAPDGKLGAGISNEDRKVFERLKGKMEDPSVPADTRLAAWKQLKTKMERLKGLESKTPTKGGNAAPQKTPVIPTLTPEQVRANPNIKRWRRSDNGEVMVRQ